MPKSILERPLAFTDVETTGLDAIDIQTERMHWFGMHLIKPVFWHEIIEIGLILVDQSSLLILDSLNIKVKPEHPERMTPKALEVNGYNERDWIEAVSLRVAMSFYSRLTKDAMIANQNVGFDWSFVDVAFKMTGVECKMDYHRLDIFSMAWGKLRDRGLRYFNLDGIAEFFGMPKEPLPHRAINGATRAYEVYKKLMEL